VVAARREELKKFCDVPCLDSRAHKSVVKYVYEYMVSDSRLPEIPESAASCESLDWIVLD
jgi:hypothetical protein